MCRTSRNLLLQTCSHRFFRTWHSIWNISNGFSYGNSSSSNYLKAHFEDEPFLDGKMSKMYRFHHVFIQTVHLIVVLRDFRASYYVLSLKILT